MCGVATQVYQDSREASSSDNRSPLIEPSKTMERAKTNARSKTARNMKQRERRVTERQIVDHSYSNHLHDPFDLPPSISLNDADSKKKKGPRGGVTVAFPEKLHEMLTAVSEEGLEHVVSWRSHGRCFLVHNKEEFLRDVMPR